MQLCKHVTWYAGLPESSPAHLRKLHFHEGRPSSRLETRLGCFVIGKARERLEAMIRCKGWLFGQLVICGEVPSRLLKYLGVGTVSADDREI